MITSACGVVYDRILIKKKNGFFNYIKRKKIKKNCLNNNHDKTLLYKKKNKK